MKSQICFNADRVTVINLTKESPSTYKFYPALIPRQKYIFGIIPFGKTRKRPDRWAQGDPEDSYQPNDDMIKDVRYRVAGEGDNRTLIVKAKIVTYLGYKEQVVVYCDSNEEAESIVNTTKSLTMNPIQTILLD